jgi:hypothetical protein
MKFYTLSMIRCMRKYPNISPVDLNPKKFKIMVEQLRGFHNSGICDESRVKELISEWTHRYYENVEKVTFDHLASYEP